MTTETKVIGGIIFATLIILAGGILFLSKDNVSPVGESEILSRTGIHWHPKLTVYIKGKKQEFTGDIGLGVIEQPIHTHAEDYKQGVVHMEMQGVVTKNQTKLGKFFQIWGKQFNANCLFDKCNGLEGTIKMTVNDHENKDFENYLMKDRDKIEVRYE